MCHIGTGRNPGDCMSCILQASKPGSAEENGVKLFGVSLPFIDYPNYSEQWSVYTWLFVD